MTDESARIMHMLCHGEAIDGGGDAHEVLGALQQVSASLDGLVESTELLSMWQDFFKVAMTRCWLYHNICDCRVVMIMVTFELLSIRDEAQLPFTLARAAHARVRAHTAGAAVILRGIVVHAYGARCCSCIAGAAGGACDRRALRQRGLDAANRRHRAAVGARRGRGAVHAVVRGVAAV